MKTLLLVILLPIVGIVFLGVGYLLLVNLTFYSARPPRAPMDAEVHGRVVLGQNCPASKKDGIECESKPYETEVAISYQARPGADISVAIATVVTDADGHFSIPLRPSASGIYSLHVKGGQPFPRCQSEYFKIKTKESLEVNINCDSGVQ